MVPSRCGCGLKKSWGSFSKKRKKQLGRKKMVWIWGRGNLIHVSKLKQTNIIISNWLMQNAWVLICFVSCYQFRRWEYFVPVKLALYATAFSRYAPLKVEPLKSDSLISAAVKFALLHQSFQFLIDVFCVCSWTEHNQLRNVKLIKNFLESDNNYLKFSFIWTAFLQSSKEPRLEIIIYLSDKVEPRKKKILKEIYLRSAEPNWAAEPIPNSPRVSASYLFNSAMADMLVLNAITAAANAVETTVFHFFGSEPSIIMIFIKKKI